MARSRRPRRIPTMSESRGGGQGMTAEPPHTAEEATASELRRASFRLLVVLALYWVFQGMGYRPLLLLQLAIFSIAATMLSAKLLLVIVDVNQVNFLRTMARRLIVVGAFCAGINLLGMLMILAQRQ